MDTWTAEPYVVSTGTLLEGPRWDDREQRLYWVDIYEGLIHSVDADGGDHRTLEPGSPVGAIAFREGGGLVLALETGLALLDPGAAVWRPLGHHTTLPSTTRSNDGACDPEGRFLVGRMAWDSTPHMGACYRLDPRRPDGTYPDLVVVIGDTTISNGLGWSADGTLMYFIDSLSGGVDVFDYDAGFGIPTRRRRFVDTSGLQGIPDGLCLDADDHVWVAFHDGGVVRRYAPDGSLVGIVQVPVHRVTSCGFGGPDLGTLFITSARVDLPPEVLEAEPLSGSVFACRPGVGGVPVARYAG